MDIKIPNNVLAILEALHQAGYAAYLVGGCVRDSLLGLAPSDWDIATSAKPEQVMCCFPHSHVIGTGLQHGTVTVMMGSEQYEVTTFREDGTYTDNRHPDHVAFVEDLWTDLSRRDFTINALAWGSKTGLVDYFQGREDLARRRIACVGNPDDRFAEDALRILRAARFAATLDFSVCPSTAVAMREKAGLLERISPERIRAELDKLLLGKGVQRVLEDDQDIFFAFLPQLESGGWIQQARAIALSPCDLLTRLTLLLRACQQHEEILRQLRYDNDTRRRVGMLVQLSGDDLSPQSGRIKRLLGALGREDAVRLLAVRRAELLAKKKDTRELEQAEIVLETIIEERRCYRLRDLAVNGNDLISLGMVHGRAIGEILQALLEAVMEDQLPNERGALLEEAKKRLRKRGKIDEND